jgi:hypothetical protein
MNCKPLEKHCMCLLLYGLFNDAVCRTDYIASNDKIILELENADVLSRDLQTVNQEWPQVQSHRCINYRN